MLNIYQSNTHANDAVYLIKVVSRMYNRLLFICLVTTLLLQGITDWASAQKASQESYADTMTVVELFRSMKQSEDSIFRLSNSLIQPGSPDAIKQLNNDSLTINKSITLIDLAYRERNYGKIANVTFTKPVRLKNVDQFGLFNGFTFNDMLYWTRSNLPLARFQNCRFQHVVWLVNCQGILRFKQCHFANQLNQEFRDTILSKGIGWRKWVTIWGWNKTLNEVLISNCSFTTPYSTSAIRLKGNFDKIDITKSHFGAIFDLFQCTVQESISIDNTHFKKSINVKGLRLPRLKDVYIKWDQIDSSRIAIYENLQEEPYRAKGAKQLTDTIPSNRTNYFNLISVYSQLHESYRIHGDRASANKCYIEQKNIQTRKLKYQYRQNSTLDNFFQLRINQFLWFFCDYGTSPQKALIISMWFVLGFGCFYFFFYSEWDRINRTFLLAQYRKLTRYFSTDKRLTDIYLEDRQQELERFDELKQELDEKHQQIPSFFRFLGKPLYHLSLSQHYMMQWVYSKVEFMSGSWVDLTIAQKRKVSLVLGVSIILYIIYLLIIRAFNSIVLSINTFSTLGFGIIPVKGALRYIAIFEGFLGWFLLSIFSVTLINQILQF